jgi:hypothetical protein
MVKFVVTKPLHKKHIPKTFCKVGEIPNVIVNGDRALNNPLWNIMSITLRSKIINYWDDDLCAL